jgi:hypothetical protein
MNPLWIIAIVVCVIAIGSRAFWRGLGILLKTTAAIAAGAALVAVLWPAVVWVRTLELPDCRSGQKYDAERDICKGMLISKKDFADVLRRLPENVSDEDLNAAVRKFQRPTPLDRLWSVVLDWNRRHKKAHLHRLEQLDTTGRPFVDEQRELSAWAPNHPELQWLTQAIGCNTEDPVSTMSVCERLSALRRKAIDRELECSTLEGQEQEYRGCMDTGVRDGLFNVDGLWWSGGWKQGILTPEAQVLIYGDAQAMEARAQRLTSARAACAKANGQEFRDCMASAEAAR